MPPCPQCNLVSATNLDLFTCFFNTAGGNAYSAHVKDSIEFINHSNVSTILIGHPIIVNFQGYQKLDQLYQDNVSKVQQRQVLQSPSSQEESIVDRDNPSSWGTCSSWGLRDSTSNSFYHVLSTKINAEIVVGAAITLGGTCSRVFQYKTTWRYTVL